MKESNLTHKLRIFDIENLNTKCKDCKSRENLFTKNFTYTKKFYVHEICLISNYSNDVLLLRILLLCIYSVCANSNDVLLVRILVLYIYPVCAIV